MEDSANGTFVTDVAFPQRGKLIDGLAWTFRNGHVTDFTAKRNLQFAQTNWTEATGSKDMFGAIAFGRGRSNRRRLWRRQRLRSRK